MLFAYEDLGVLTIKDYPMDETRVPLTPIETHEEAVRIRDWAMAQRREVRWKIVGKGPWGVREEAL